jgi:NADPH-dependent 2,4-dienoyl-CoA reductase/sulfur reductase-like enzyme
VTQGYARAYDTLVMAVGSGTNDFGTPGVAEHAIALETPEEAGRFHRRLVNACLRAHMQAEPLGPGQLNVAIIGAGATGVELAAELHKATRTLVSYNLERIDPERDTRIHLIEAGPRILPALPERIAGSAANLLTKLGVRVQAHARVTSVDAQGVLLASDQPPEPTGRRARAAEHARRAHLRHRRLRRRPLAGPRGRRVRAAARAGGAPAGQPPGHRAAARAARPGAAPLALPRLRLAGLAG